MWLEPYECVEADDGYIGEAPYRVKCPKCLATTEEQKAMANCVRSRQEMVNRRFKQWRILHDVYQGDISMHRDVFASIAVITQLSINNGKKLFQVEYIDEPASL